MVKKTVKARRRGYTVTQKSFPWKAWIIGGAAVLVVGVVGFMAVSAANRKSEENSVTATVARENAGGDIQVLTGTRHTVYRSLAPLPTAQKPRADGKPTLVWFSGTSCEYCEQMEPFAHQTAKQFSDRAVFVEKSVDEDRNVAAAYAVRGTPTFVLIDANGRELARFGFQSTAAAFTKAIESSLARIRS